MGHQRLIPAPRLNPYEQLDDQLDEYRALVSTVFAEHRKLPLQQRCTCGDAWPCGSEERAAQLLDWV
ncbi:MAG: hypothetical protein L0Y54_09665 [Sporichthyaceae bacterium]|nr:hypothetical protein [Sporichthyaceae bacterium]